MSNVFSLKKIGKIPPQYLICFLCNKIRLYEWFFQHCVNYERYRRSILCIPLTTTTPLTCGYWLEIPYFVHYMCIGADLNQDHFSPPRSSQAFFSIIHAKPWTLLFLSAPSFVFLSWPAKEKKALFFSLSLWMEWEWIIIEKKAWKYSSVSSTEAD